jgi:hypothetical protein
VRAGSRRWKAVVAVVASGLLIGVAGGSVTAYVAQREVAEDVARGRAADSARLQGQADAYLSELAIQRGRAADAQRLQAYADWWLGTHR